MLVNRTIAFIQIVVFVVFAIVEIVVAVVKVFVHLVILHALFLILQNQNMSGMQIFQTKFSPYVIQILVTLVIALNAPLVAFTMLLLLLF